MVLHYKIKTSLAELLHSTSTIIFYFYDFTEIIKLRKFLEFFTVPLEEQVVFFLMHYPYKFCYMLKRIALCETTTKEAHS